MTCFKIIGLDIDYKSDSELKKIVCGVSSNYENLVFLTRLFEHANLCEKLFYNNIPQNALKINKQGTTKQNNKLQPLSYKQSGNFQHAELNDDINDNENIFYDYIECMPSSGNEHTNENRDEGSELFSFENLKNENINYENSMNNSQNIINLNFQAEKNNLNMYDTKRYEAGNNRNTDNNNNYNMNAQGLNKRQIVDNEIINSVKIIDNIIKNKREILKEKIRLFPPEIKIREKKNFDSLNLAVPADLLREYEREHAKRKNEMIEKLQIYEKNMLKVDKKLEKLKCKVNESYELMETEDYLKLKQNLIIFEKKIDNFIRDFNQLFAQDIKYIPQEKFSNLHQVVEEFEIKSEKLFNLGKSLEEVFSFISKMIQ